MGVESSECKISQKDQEQHTGFRRIRDSFVGIGELFSQAGSFVRKIHEAEVIVLEIRPPHIPVNERVIKYGTGGALGAAGITVGFLIAASNPDISGYIGGGLLGIGSLAAGTIFAQNPN